MNQKADYGPLKHYLTGLAPLTESEWESFCALTQVRQYDKKEIFQTYNTKCKIVGFILEGCFRWVKNNDGQERTFDFAIENEFVTNYQSIVTGQPCDVAIIAVEKSTVVCIDAQKLLQLFDTGFNWQKIGRHLAEYVACYAFERLVSSYYESPGIRYDNLMKTSPHLFLRIPHHILANYLGMTKETLSRLRKPTK
jgi:CRP-like cAMP-binding protein